METLTAGTITVVFSSMVALMRPLKSLTNVNAQFQRGMAACQTLFAILDMEQEKDTGKLELKKPTGDIEFRNVTFQYVTKDTPALKNISFTIPAGKTVALVGRSGSGKSTIANLLTRFYDINEGEILINGHDIREYTLKSLRNQVALVSQNVHLLMKLWQTISSMLVKISIPVKILKKRRKWHMRWILSKKWIKA